jgi:hypothetical protein
VAKIISRAQITKAIVGEGNSYRSIIISALLASTFLFYIYTFGSYFRIPVYVIQNRLTYTKIFADTYIVNRNADHLLIALATVVWLVLSIRGGKTRFVISGVYGSIAIGAALSRQANVLDITALLSIPIVVSLLIYNIYCQSAKKVLNNTQTKLSVNYFAIICIVIGIFSVTISSALVIFPSTELSIPQYIRNYTFDIFLLISSSSTLLMFLLINSFLLKLSINLITSKMPKIKNYRDRIILTLSSAKVNSRYNITFLSLIVLLSIAIVLIPHQATVNKTNKQIGTDTGRYVSLENKLMHSKDAGVVLQNAFVKLSGGDRPLALLFFFTAIKLFPNSNLSSTMDLVPIILAPTLVLVVFCLTRELTSNDIASLLAGFLTSVSFQTLIGLYAGFYANWLALVVGYLSIVFLIRFLKRPSKAKIILFLILDLMILFTHTYTWTILTIVMAIFLLVMLKSSYFPKKSILFLLLIIVSSVVVDVARNKMTAGYSGAIGLDVFVAYTTRVGPEQLAHLWTNLNDATQIYLGNILGNFIILGLGIYWLLRSNLVEASNIFIVIFLSIGLLPLFFGDWQIQSRVYYNIPFQIPAAIGLVYIAKEGKTLLIPACGIWLVAIAIKSLFNF